MAGFAFLPGYGLTALTPAPPPPSLCALPTPALCFFGTTFSPASLPFFLFLNSSSFHGVWWQLAELSGIAALLEETWSEPRGLVGWDGIRASL